MFIFPLALACFSVTRPEASCCSDALERWDDAQNEPISAPSAYLAAASSHSGIRRDRRGGRSPVGAREESGRSLVGARTESSRSTVRVRLGFGRSPLGAWPGLGQSPVGAQSESAGVRSEPSGPDYRCLIRCSLLNSAAAARVPRLLLSGSVRLAEPSQCARPSRANEAIDRTVTFRTRPGLPAADPPRRCQLSPGSG